MFPFTGRCGSRCETGPVPFPVSLSWWSEHHSSSVNVSTKKCGEKAWPEATYPPNENEQRYQLKWLDKTTARICYGCGGKLRPSDSSVPPPPFDIVVTTKEYRCWYDKSTETTKISKKPEATHYHVDHVCILAKNSEFQASLHLKHYLSRSGKDAR